MNEQNKTKSKIIRALSASQNLPKHVHSWIVDCIDCGASLKRLNELEQDSMIEYEKLIELSSSLVGYDGRIYAVQDGRRRVAGELAESAARCKTRYRATHRINGLGASSHRLIFFQANGCPVLMPPVVDHINGQSLDNRPDNLRASTLVSNNRNRNSRKWGSISLSSRGKRGGAPRWRLKPPKSSGLLAKDFSSNIENEGSMKLKRQEWARKCGINIDLDGNVLDEPPKPYAGCPSIPPAMARNLADRLRANIGGSVDFWHEAFSCKASIGALSEIAMAAKNRYESFAKIDECADVFGGNVICKTTGSMKNSRPKNKEHYSQVRVNGEAVSTHRFILWVKDGRPAFPSELVDHINRDRHDNRPENLRASSGYRNAQNRNRHNRDGRVYGRVEQCPEGRYTPLVGIDGGNSSISVGTFEDLRDARAATVACICANYAVCVNSESFVFERCASENEVEESHGLWQEIRQRYGRFSKPGSITETSAGRWTASLQRNADKYIGTYSSKPEAERALYLAARAFGVKLNAYGEDTGCYADKFEASAMELEVHHNKTILGTKRGFISESIGGMSRRPNFQAHAHGSSKALTMTTRRGAEIAIFLMAIKEGFIVDHDCIVTGFCADLPAWHGEAWLRLDQLKMINRKYGSVFQRKDGKWTAFGKCKDGRKPFLGNFSSRDEAFAKADSNAKENGVIVNKELICVGLVREPMLLNFGCGRISVP